MRPASKAPEIAIVGGGVMGCATALALAERGARVVVIERAVPGAEASSAAAGILGAQAESHEPSDALGTFVRARAEYPAWAAKLRALTGIDVGHRVSGVLRIARSEEEHAVIAVEALWQREAGLRAELVDGRRAREIEPEIAEDVASAAYYPDDAQVDPPSLLRALVAAMSKAGAEVRSGSTVHRLIVESGRCRGVELDDGELRADATVLAAGSWSSLVPGLPAMPPVRPARGQMLQLEERPPRMRTIVFAKGAYVVPRGDGRILCGSTVEFVGFRKEVTAGGLHAILGSALAAVPSLAPLPIVSTWSSFRPHTAGGNALVGASELPGLYLATGHFRNGILLAKVTADAVADAVLV